MAQLSDDFLCWPCSSSIDVGEPFADRLKRFGPLLLGLVFVFPKPKGFVEREVRSAVGEFGVQEIAKRSGVVDAFDGHDRVPL